MKLNTRDKKFAEDISKQIVTFKDFKKFALDSSLSDYEKIGFPEAYRKDLDEIILSDLKNKLPALKNGNSIVVDIGCGCSQLTKDLIDNSVNLSQELYLCDSDEMLNILDTKESNISKIAGQFPYNYEEFAKLENKVDAVIIYSVLQVVLNEDNIYNFLDSAVELLKPGGKLLIGDIPNISKRNRFFASDAGKQLHKEYTNSDELPELSNYKVNKHKIDDGIINSILQRYRNFGFETYLLPQDSRLPMSNRREDILIVRN